MRKLGLSTALVCLLAANGASAAVNCHVETVPAATLLLPYFEVDLNNSSNHTTGVAISNASNQPVLVKAEVWSDLGVPIFGFNIALKPYDVSTFNLRDVLGSGILPQSQPGGFASCVGALPPATLSAGLVYNYDRALTGQSVDLYGGLCAGRNLHDNVVRGYMTFDTVNNCSLRFQGDPGYFGTGGSGDATNQNVLTGDYYYQNNALDHVEAHPLVALIADGTNPETSVAGNYTFYGKFAGWTAADNRVPTATNFSVRYNNSYPLGTDIVVWRDSKVQQGPFSCATLPLWYPLSATSIVAFDEDGHSTALATNAFPAVAQRVPVGVSTLFTPYQFGWFFLDLNTTVAGASFVPPEDTRASQAWVTATWAFQNGQQAGIGLESFRLDSACTARHSGL